MTVSDDPKNILRDILNAQRIRPGDPELTSLRQLRQEVESMLRTAFGSRPTIKYAGSRAKFTMIRSAYDLDMTCYFDAGDNSGGSSLEEIYNNVADALGAMFTVTRRRSALRLTPKHGDSDVHVDVVPGRFTDDTRSEAYLYQSEGEKSRLKTNVDAHIAHVRDSGHADVVSFFKLWATERDVPVKTFALELAVIDALKDTDSPELSDRVETVLDKFSDDIDGVRVEDPANPTGNDLSHLWNDDVRAAVCAAALETIEASDPRSFFEKHDREILALAAGGASAVASGYLFAKKQDDGTKKFNWGAAIFAGLAAWAICR